MTKTAIVIDSSAGFSQVEAHKNNWFFLPLLIFIDDKKLQDGIDITSDNLFEHYHLESGTAKTSATPLGIATDLLAKLSSEYDQVVVFPISKHLSSQNQMLINLAQDFPNVKVIESLYVAELIPLKIRELESLLEKGVSLEEAVAYLNNWDTRYDVTLVPKFNDYLVKGGRLSPAAATLAKLLQIVPMIKFEAGELLKEGKGRTFNKTVQKVIDSKFANHNNDEYDCVILHSDNQEIEQYLSYVKENYGLEPFVAKIPNVVAMHTGPEAIVIIKAPKLTEGQKALF
ncbi:DegV family protein [Mycoplasma hafezii]|uniref:DegV family protein n=1 Tax=Mycoplasma hafezii TaxID=525886 RepID=UPI003CEC3D66